MYASTYELRPFIDLLLQLLLLFRLCMQARTSWDHCLTYFYSFCCCLGYVRKYVRVEAISWPTSTVVVDGGLVAEPSYPQCFEGYATVLVYLNVKIVDTRRLWLHPGSDIGLFRHSRHFCSADLLIKLHCWAGYLHKGPGVSEDSILAYWGESFQHM